MRGHEVPLAHWKIRADVGSLDGTYLRSVRAMLQQPCGNGMVSGE
jgi:hypothetical protein